MLKWCVAVGAAYRVGRSSQGFLMVIPFSKASAQQGDMAVDKVGVPHICQALRWSGVGQGMATEIPTPVLPSASDLTTLSLCFVTCACGRVAVRAV